MNHTGNLTLVFGFDRNAVAVVPHGDNGILKITSVGTIYHAGKLGMYLFADQCNGAAHMFKPRAGIIGNLLLGKNASVYLVCKGSQRFQALEIIRQGGLFFIIPDSSPVSLDPVDIVKQTCNFKKLRYGQGTADFQRTERHGDILIAAKGG